MEKTPDYRLVITIALKKEVPEGCLISHHIPVCTLASLKSGALRRKNAPNADMLIIITGAGHTASEEAACWIRDNINPLHVVNIGTCGLTDRTYAPGKWIIPQYVANEEGDRLKLDTQIPLIHHGDMIDVHSLLSVKKPCLGDLPMTWKKHEAVDMECYFQAKVFADTNINFHCLKFSTDYSDHNALSDFDLHLDSFNQQLPELFSPSKGGDGGIRLDRRD
ncbi:MAG: hypothetical protein C4560_13315 [Nitrospiraceae bacterium]|nr:MAG: hypothetical protein C4560_13315 [Nitrospiraceae bacterium]